MTFLWPQGLWLLLLVPAIVAGYRWVQGAKGVIAARHPGLALTSEKSWARHLPPVLFVLAMVLLLTAIARPTALMVVPTDARTVILAIDVSGSMRADDVAPTRLAAAQGAARDFVRALPSGARIGIVAFSDDASLTLAPVADRGQVLAAIATLHTQDSTAIGSGILASLRALFPQGRFNLDEAIGVPAPAGAGIDETVAIILLTDGQNSRGPDPIDAAHLAAGRGVRVYTVGVGTAYGQIDDERGWRMTVGIDEESLKAIASSTGAEYFYASSAPDLKAVYSRLGASVALARIRTEISGLLCAFAALAATVSAAMSLLWFGRVL